MQSFMNGLMGKNPTSNVNHSNKRPNSNTRANNMPVEHSNANPANANQVETKMNNQTGGMAPVNARVPMLQPSERVMQWAVTAGLPTPTKGMEHVAHGGKGKSRKGKSRKSKSHKSKSRKSKSHKSKSRK
jgi:hypothetical protein